jgi:WD40 repeat protein
MAFDPKNAKLNTACEVPGILFGLCHDAARDKLYGAGTDWSVYCVDLKAENLTTEKKWTNHENYVSALGLLGNDVISASYDRRIIWTNAETGEQVRSVVAHKGWVRDLAVFPNGKQLVSVGDDMLVNIWNGETGELLNTLDGHDKQTPQGYTTALYAVAIAPDGKHIASGDRTGTVCIWETSTGKLLGKLHAPTFYTYDARARVRSIGGIRSLCFSPDGLMLAIGGIGLVSNVDGFVGPCRMELWDWQTGQRTGTCQDKHNAVLNQIAFHPSEPYVIAAGGGDSGGILAFWDTKKEKPIHKAKPKGHLQQLIVTPDGNRLLAAGHDGFQIWDLVGATK